MPGTRRGGEKTMSTVTHGYLYDTAEIILGFVALVLPFVAIPVMLA